MMIFDQNDKVYIVGQKLHEGGEGELFQLQGEDSYLYKQYAKPTGEHEQKIRHLSSFSSLRGSDGVALPITPIYLQPKTNQQGTFSGLIIPYIKDANTLYSYLNPQERVKQHPECTVQHLYLIARNLAAQVEHVHSWKHTVIGDLNATNVLVTKDLRVVLVDFDSVQYTNGKVYPCRVGMPEYIPPEGRGEGGVISQEHDLFALAVLIFQLLRMGQYPFKGKMKVNIEKQQVGLYLKNKGIYPYINHRVAGPPDNAMPYDWLEPELREAFNRTFHFGSKDPSKRVAAADWKALLRKCLTKLQTCPQHPKYQYGSHLKSCPWCGLVK